MSTEQQFIPIMSCPGRFDFRDKRIPTQRPAKARYPSGIIEQKDRLSARTREYKYLLNGQLGLSIFYRGKCIGWFLHKQDVPGGLLPEGGRAVPPSTVSTVNGVPGSRGVEKPFPCSLKTHSSNPTRSRATHQTVDPQQCPFFSVLLGELSVPSAELMTGPQWMILDISQAHSLFVSLRAF